MHIGVKVIKTWIFFLNYNLLFSTYTRSFEIFRWSYTHDQWQDWQRSANEVEFRGRISNHSNTIGTSIKNAVTSWEICEVVEISLYRFNFPVSRKKSQCLINLYRFLVSVCVINALFIFVQRFASRHEKGQSEVHGSHEWKNGNDV